MAKEQRKWQKKTETEINICVSVCLTETEISYFGLVISKFLTYPKFLIQWSLDWNSSSSQDFWKKLHTYIAGNFDNVTRFWILVGRYSSSCLVLYPLIFVAPNALKLEAKYLFILDIDHILRALRADWDYQLFSRAKF